MHLFTVSQMRAIEKAADARGHSYAAMMQRAGEGLADVTLDLLEGVVNPVVLGLVGPGNNGGDTLVALTALAQSGIDSYALIVRREQDDLVQKMIAAGGRITNDIEGALKNADVVLDGFLGTGVKHPLRRDGIYQALENIHAVLDGMQEIPLVIAVDCPSGIDCDSGEAEPVCFHADLTVTFAGIKQGLLKLPAFEYAGEIEVVDIGLPDDLDALKEVKNHVADDQTISALLPKRTLDSHKGTFGSALIVAGSLQYTGALILACKAAYRAGAGLVQAAIPASVHAPVSGHVPEAVWILLPEESGFISAQAGEVLLERVGRSTALLVGPGLGTMISTGNFIEIITSKAQIPIVVDADGLRHLANIKEWNLRLRAPAILTPHLGEMSVLTGLTVQEIQDDRHGVALKYAKQWGHVVVLKGAFTVIAAPDGRLTVIPVATPALARAGSGDVLAGVITGLLAQGLQSFDAAVAGAYIHAHAGLLAAEKMGTTASVLASDVLECISDVIGGLE